MEVSGIGDCKSKLALSKHEKDEKIVSAEPRRTKIDRIAAGNALAEKDRDVGWIEQLNFLVGGIATEIKLKFRAAVLARHHRRNGFGRAIGGS